MSLKKGAIMDKTKVDDILLEMIRPKIEEIEKKFSSGKPLTQDDINTLLLKSQYNHINHLDQKLNETVESVKALEHKFDMLEERVNHKLSEFEQKLDSSITALEQKLDSSITALEQKLDNSIQTLRQEQATAIAALEEKMEATIQKALNKNMLSLIMIIGFFFTLFKIIDIFAQGH